MKEYKATVREECTEWRRNGKLDREDGPAIEWYDGDMEWWLNGKEYTEADFLTKTTAKELTIALIEEILGHKIKIVK